MKFARYLEEQSVPEWKKAYLNYRGMKKLIKRVHEHRSKRLALAELERMASRGGSCPSGTGFPNFRRRGTFRGMTRRSTNDTDQDEPTIEPNALSSKEDQSFSPEGIARERDSLLPISLVGTGLQLQDDLLKSPSNLEEAGGSRLVPIPKVLSNIASRLDSRFPTTNDNQMVTEVQSPVTSSVEHSRSDDVDGSSHRTVTWSSAATNYTQDQDQLGASINAKPKLNVSSDLRNDPDEADALDSDGTQVEENPQIFADVAKSRDEFSTPNPRKRGLGSRSGSEGRFSFRGKNKASSGNNKAGRSGSSLQDLISENFDQSEAQVFSAASNELERVLDFFDKREEEIKDRFAVLARQLKELADHRQHFKAKFEAESPGTSKALSGVISFPSIRPLLTGQTASEGTHQKALEDTRSSGEDEGSRRRSLALAEVMQAEISSLKTPELEEQSEKTKSAAHNPETYRNARKKLKAALVDYYRTLELLRNFKILNRTGFQKSMKKLEKTVHVAGISESWYSEKVSQTALVKSDRIEKLIKATEGIFAAYFEHGNRKRAVERLRAGTRSTLGETSSHHLSVFRSGIFLGIALCATVAGIVQTHHPNTFVEIPNHEELYKVYGALFLPPIFALLFGLNLMAWNRNRINATFIFEWDVRHTIDYTTYFEMPTFFLLLLSLCFWVSFLNPFPDSIAPTSWPLVWIVAVLLILLNPIHIMNYRSRTWFVRSVLRVFQAGVLSSIEFRDFFLGDELNSLAYTISSLWLIGCEYDRKWKTPDTCHSNGTFWTAALASLPAFLRLIQCLRRFKDSESTAYLHLVNAGKYASTILYHFFYQNYKRGSQGNKDLALLWVFGIIYSLYTSTWDITMDWSLLKRNCKYPLLRNELAFESTWPLYYFSVCSNVILRFGWSIYLLPGPASTTLKVFIIALLEVLRRFQWNFYRLENEHLGNVDIYRVCRDVPLPYRIPSEDDLDDEDCESGAPRKSRFEKFKLTRRRPASGEDKLKPTEPHFQTDLGSHSDVAVNSKDHAEQASPFKARLRSQLAPDANVNKGIDESGAARGRIGKDYNRKNLPALDVDIDEE